MAVDAITYNDGEGGVVVKIPPISPTTVNSVGFVENRQAAGVVTDKKEGVKNAIFVS